MLRLAIVRCVVDVAGAVFVSFVVDAVRIVAQQTCRGRSVLGDGFALRDLEADVAVGHAGGAIGEEGKIARG